MQTILCVGLHELVSKENPSLLELAQVMGCSHQNVKSIVMKLQDKGFLNLYVDAKDKRKQRVSLTQKAYEVGETYSSKETDFMNRLFDGIEERNLAETFATLTRMENNLIKMEDGGNKK